MVVRVMVTKNNPNYNSCISVNPVSIADRIFFVKKNIKFANEINNLGKSDGGAGVSPLKS